MKAIAAMSRNRVIGRGGGLPWHLPEDFRWFKRATLGHAVLMGRRTFESLPKGPLPGRLNLVATRGELAAVVLPPGGGDGGDAGVEIVRDLDDFRPEPYEASGREVFVAGGEAIYRQMLPRCAEVLLTLVDRDVEDGDAFFPPFEDRFQLAEVLSRGDGFEVRRYVVATRG